MSLPDHLRAKGYARLDKPTRAKVEHYAKILEFQDTNELEDGHIQNLSRFPYLTSVSITVNPYSTNLSDVPSRASHWGPLVFRAFLKALSARSGLQDITPVRTFEVKGLTGECLVLDRNSFDAGQSAFASLHSVAMALAHAPDNCLAMLGRFLSSAKDLRRLVIGRHGDFFEDGDDFPTIHLKPLVAPSSLERNCAGQKPPFNVFYWPNLRVINLSEFVFTPKLIIEFLTRHKHCLKEISFTNCYLRPDCPPCPLHSHGANNEEPDPEWSSWQYIFRQMRILFSTDTQSSLSSKSPLKTVELMALSAGRDAHEHLAQSEAHRWGEYLTGKSDQEPEKEPFEGLWCSICQPPDEDDDEENDDDGSGNSPLGFPWNSMQHEDDDTEEDDLDEDDDFYYHGGAGDSFGMPPWAGGFGYLGHHGHGNDDDDDGTITVISIDSNDNSEESSEWSDTNSTHSSALGIGPLPDWTMSHLHPPKLSQGETGAHMLESRENSIFPNEEEDVEDGREEDGVDVVVQESDQAKCSDDEEDDDKDRKSHHWTGPVFSGWDR